MGQKKKIKNKQNYHPIKKTTIQQINYTQQINIPTLNTIEYKNLTKSIDLKKQIPNKKPASRKSRCLSVKQTCTSVKQTTTQPIKYKQLLRRFQQLKGLQQRVERSKSKSAKSIRQCNKSRSPVSHSKSKLNPKKFNLTCLVNKTLPKNKNRTQFNSRMSLTNKLQKTLKKLNQNDYFNKDQEDSLIPFISTSQICQNQEYSNMKAREVQSNQFAEEDEINILQMRRFCRTLQNQELFESNFKKSINYFRGDQYQMMAVKIQRAWRRYRTKKLVDRYAQIFYNNYIQETQSQQQENPINYSSNSSQLKYAEEDFLRKEFLKQKEFRSQINKKELRIEQIAKQQISSRQISQHSDDNPNSSIESDNSNQRLLQSQKLYPESVIKQEHLITYISNLEDQQNSAQLHQKLQTGQFIQKTENQVIKQQGIDQNQDGYQIQNEQYQRLINQIKRTELQKWKEVIQMLQQSKSKKNSHQLQSILTRLQRQSQKNKKQLQQIQKQQIISVSNQSSHRNAYPEGFYESQKFSKEQKKQIRRGQQSGPSETSDLKRQEQFDSRKYIEYLDSDMFLLERDKSSENSQRIIDEKLGRKISKRKQKHLLAVLNIDETPIRLRSHNVSKSQNLSYLMEGQAPYPSVANPRLNKSISQKNIEKFIKEISPQLVQYQKQQIEGDQLNLDLIRKEFLQNADPIEQLDKLHTNQELKMKIKQSLQFQSYQDDSHQSSEQQFTHPARISLDLSKTFDELEKNQAIINSRNHFQSNKQNHFQSSKQYNNTGTVVIIENIDKSIEQEDQNQQSDDEEQKQKIQNLCFMVYNTLILEILRQIAAYDPILQKFKTYSLTIKSQQKQGKKGFQTNHTEVKHYVDGLVNYLLHQQPQVFKNLQIPAGPSALQMLHYMHPNENDQEVDEDQNASQDQTSVMVIPNRMFDKYWSTKQKVLKFQSQATMNMNPQRKKKLLDDLRNWTKVFYRSIFDTFNQCLDLERNFGQAGKPYPWKKTSTFHHVKTLDEIQKSIQNSQKRMTEIATTYCGLIIQKNQMARITMQGSDDYIQHVQQDRMSRMLAQDLIEGQERWTFYDDQQLQLLVQIGNFITISLVVEAGQEINCLFKR